MEREPRTPAAHRPAMLGSTAQRIVVRADREVTADSAATLTSGAASYPAVQYPTQDSVDPWVLRQSAISCYRRPDFGDACSCSVNTPDGANSKAMRTFEQPYPGVDSIAGYLSLSRPGSAQRRRPALTQPLR